MNSQPAPPALQTVRYDSSIISPCDYRDSGILAAETVSQGVTVADVHHFHAVQKRILVVRNYVQIIWVDNRDKSRSLGLSTKAKPKA